MRPTTATHDNVFDFQALLHPGTVFEHPRDVVAHPDLTLAENAAAFLQKVEVTLQDMKNKDFNAVTDHKMVNYLNCLEQNAKLQG